ncbi:hypothetical protein STEG23_025121 [Scotinomys teguina]
MAVELAPVVQEWILQTKSFELHSLCATLLDSLNEIITQARINIYHPEYQRNQKTIDPSLWNILEFLGTSSAEVKENRNVSNLGTRPLPTGDWARGSTPSIKRKRPLEEGNAGHFCKLQLIWKKLSWSMTPKNALVQLHELKPGLQYRMVSQTGPVHAPVFAVAVEVNGLTFEGTGPTKKKAKMRAAEMALKSFVQFPNAFQAHLAMGSNTSSCTDFTSDQADFPDTLFKEFEPSSRNEDFPGCGPVDTEFLSSAYRRGRLLYHTLDLMGQALPDRSRLAPGALGERNPVVVLNELRSGLRYVCLSETAEKPRVKSFVMAVCVDGRTFEGSGRSKKLAKGQAAQAALQALFNIRLPGHTPSRSKSNLLPQVKTIVTALEKEGQLKNDGGKGPFVSSAVATTLIQALSQEIIHILLKTQTGQGDISTNKAPAGKPMNLSLIAGTHVVDEEN